MKDNRPCTLHNNLQTGLVVHTAARHRTYQVQDKALLPWPSDLAPLGLTRRHSLQAYSCASFATGRGLSLPGNSLGMQRGKRKVQCSLSFRAPSTAGHAWHSY